MGTNVMEDPLRNKLIGRMAEIRCFEQTLLELFAAGKLYGTTHTCIGQEACAVSLYANLDPGKDVAFSNHRCHGHYLAFDGEPEILLSEIMGKQGGVCGGRGGSQHLCNGHFFSQGIQGAGVPIAVGCAYFKKSKGLPGIVVCHIGDGTLGQGVVYESLNMAGVLDVPFLLMLEHNGVAQSTDTSRTTAGDIVKRLGGFGIPVDRREAADPLPLARHMEEVVAYVRGGKPFIQILDTYRLMAHSKGDDNRPQDQVKAAWKRDWFDSLLRQKDPEVTRAWDAAKAKTTRAVAAAEKAAVAELGDASPLALPPTASCSSSSDLAAKPEQTDRVNQLLNRALDSLLAAEPGVQLLGEDIADGYGGAFKVTQGLSTKYPHRVFSTPISEAALVGLANGWAIQGGHPIVEIMFADFAALATDQIINQAAKMFFLYNGQVTVPITIRLVSGGYRGYGATHSQCSEYLYSGIPGLKVVALSRRHDPGKLLSMAAMDPSPVIFVENKALYAQRPIAEAPAGMRFIPVPCAGPGEYPMLQYTSAEGPRAADVTLVTYGGMTDMAEQVMESLLLQEEIDFDYFVLSGLDPVSIEPLQESVRRTGTFVFVEETHVSCGIGAAWLARVAESVDQPFRARRVGAKPLPIPSARNIERQVLPSSQDILAAILEVLD